MLICADASAWGFQEGVYGSLALDSRRLFFHLPTRLPEEPYFIVTILIKNGVKEYKP
jgi:hypothetical protein